MMHLCPSICPCVQVSALGDKDKEQLHGQCQWSVLVITESVSAITECVGDHGVFWAITECVGDRFGRSRSVLAITE